MDLNKIPVLKMITTQMDWLNQRQKVLSQNIANADTPDYVAHDLAPLDFADLAREHDRKLKMSVSSPSHIPDPNSQRGEYRDKENKKFTPEPSGNGVVLEEQAMLVSSTQVDYELIAVRSGKELLSDKSGSYQRQHHQNERRRQNETRPLRRQVR